MSACVCVCGLREKESGVQTYKQQKDFYDKVFLCSVWLCNQIQISIKYVQVTAWREACYRLFKFP